MEREDFLVDPQRQTFLSYTLPRAGVSDPRVIQAMADVRREAFVPPELVPHAYDDSPLPLKLDQTISQPSLVAMMTQALNLEPEHRVLEIGTGSGYQTAVLARLANHVYTVERIDELKFEAEGRLSRLGYENIKFRTADGAEGWAENAPYDRIIVTAAAKTLPTALLDQLSPAGRLVIPIGESQQELFLYVKGPTGIEVRSLLPVSFVPLVPGVDDPLAG